MFYCRQVFIGAEMEFPKVYKSMFSFCSLNAMMSLKLRPKLKSTANTHEQAPWVIHTVTKQLVCHMFRLKSSADVTDEQFETNRQTQNTAAVYEEKYGRSDGKHYDEFTLGQT